MDSSESYNDDAYNGEIRSHNVYYRREYIHTADEVEAI